jgi:hypothetical protein
MHYLSIIIIIILSMSESYKRYNEDDFVGSVFATFRHSKVMGDYKSNVLKIDDLFNKTKNSLKFRKNNWQFEENFSSTELYDVMNQMNFSRLYSVKRDGDNNQKVCYYNNRVFV